MKPVRILIVDEHKIIRRGLRSLLATRSDGEVCGEAADGIEAIEKARQLRPDVILLDITLPQLSGLEAASQIRREVPRARLVIVSQHDPLQMKSKAVAVGAHAYVTKIELAQDLLPAIDSVLQKTN
jgi:DNA-binding NarL/FixJ family response regulator